MSCSIHCPSCGELLGDVGLTASGDMDCSACGDTFEVGYQTLANVGGA